MKEVLSNPFSLRARLKGLKMKYSEMTCLDLACGKNESPISKAVLEIPWQTLVSVDAWRENINVLHAKRAMGEIAAENWVQYMEEMEKLLPRLPVGGYDVVVLLDAIEHLDKQQGLQLLKDVEALQPRRVILWVPLGVCPQGALGGNPYEVHKSTWEKGEFEELGYKVKVFKGFHKHFDPPVDAAWVTKSL